MQVDFAVELGEEHETLEFPWTDPDGGLQYFDLKRHPEKIANIEETARAEALRGFLVTVNAPTSLLESAKCDTWSTTEISPEEEIFGAPWKFGSYVDLLFSDHASRFSFEQHEALLRRLTQLLKRVPEIPATADFLLRRGIYHKGSSLREGFYVTFYLFGFGQDEGKARLQWEIALKLVASAVAQVSGTSAL